MKNKFLAVVCFIYSLLIIFVWFNGSLNNFLAPNMQIYLKLSIIPMVIMGIVIILNKIHYKYRSTDLVLLLPIIMVFMYSIAIYKADLIKIKYTVIITCALEIIYDIYYNAYIGAILCVLNIIVVIISLIRIKISKAKNK